ncbi:52 kDa repressor of the inhibitor of the protein kinase-like, partial [Saccostrea cucullata]|uniref:52 kDa repressor of the inhibitor of the protein kinase-like n=1 Tax=Saccostrea cuccullata TaxID=36930 RepID=UPI002ED52F48
MCEQTLKMDGHAKTGSAAYCCVPLCSEDSRRGTATSFHSFPKDPSARKEWIIKIRRDEGPDFHISKSTYVCSKHFKEDDIVKTLTGLRKLKKGTVPSIFPWTKIAPSRKPPKKREGPPQEETSVIKKKKTSSSISLDTDQHSSNASCAIYTPTDMPSEEHDYCRQAPSLEEDLE